LAFAVLKYAGGAYLVYLGGRALHAAVRAQSRVEVATAATSAKAVNAFAQGLLTNLTNPKVAVFYVTFLPQFIVPDRNVLTQSVVLAATHVAMGLLWLTLYARFIDRMAAVLLTDRVKRRMEAATGAVLMALGIRLALARR
jgi:threonine/homoserine/homoserine lactone efflux protein